MDLITVAHVFTDTVLRRARALWATRLAAHRDLLEQREIARRHGLP